MLSSNDVVLAIAEGFDGEIPGRTLLQKVGYFIGQHCGADLGYRAHYYGPYSPTVAATVNEMVELGELTESIDATTSQFEGHDDKRRYFRYTLTDLGLAAAQIHREWNPDEYEQATDLARRLKASGADYMQLAFAAKTHFILTRVEQDDVSFAEVRQAASELRWPMTERDIQRGADVLEKLGYLENAEA